MVRDGSFPETDLPDRSPVSASQELKPLLRDGSSPQPGERLSLE